MYNRKRLLSLMMSFVMAFSLCSQAGAMTVLAEDGIIVEDAGSEIPMQEEIPTVTEAVPEAQMVQAEAAPDVFEDSVDVVPEDGEGLIEDELLIDPEAGTPSDLETVPDQEEVADPEADSLFPEELMEESEAEELTEAVELASEAEEELLAEAGQEYSESYLTVVALFEALPSTDAITEETTDEEKEAFFAQLSEAMEAYEALTEEEQMLFEEEHPELLMNALALNDAITGNTAETLDGFAYELGGSPRAGAGWTWNGSTLTFNNANLNINNAYQLFRIMTDATVKLVGSSKITASHNNLAAIFGTGKLTFTGDGSLEIEAYAADGSDTSGIVYGIGSAGDMIFDEGFTGSLDIKTGNANVSTPIFTESLSGAHAFIMNGSGTITATTGGKKSQALSINGDVTINNGTLNAKGNGWRGALFAQEYKITINGGTVNAENNNFQGGAGLYATNVIINGGTVNAKLTGGEAGYGIYGWKGVQINGGDVTLQGTSGSTAINMDNSRYAGTYIGNATFHSFNFETGSATFEDAALGYGKITDISASAHIKYGAAVGFDPIQAFSGTGCSFTMKTQSTGFKAIAKDTDITSWFSKVPAAWTLTVDADVAEGAASMQVRITRADEEVLENGSIAVSVPAANNTSGNALNFETTYKYENNTKTIQFYKGNPNPVNAEGVTGYTWDADKCILTLDGFNYKTKGAYAIQLGTSYSTPATIIIKDGSVNNISAAKSAIYCAKDEVSYSIIIQGESEGTGVLNLDSPEYALFCRGCEVNHATVHANAKKAFLGWSYPAMYYRIRILNAANVAMEDGAQYGLLGSTNEGEITIDNSVVDFGTTTDTTIKNADTVIISQTDKDIPTKVTLSTSAAHKKVIECTTGGKSIELTNMMLSGANVADGSSATVSPVTQTDPNTPVVIQRSNKVVDTADFSTGVQADIDYAIGLLGGAEHAAWDASTNTLTMTDVDFTTGGNPALQMPTSGDSYIKINGENTIRSTAVLSVGNVVYTLGGYGVHLSGEGTLNVMLDPSLTETQASIGAAIGVMDMYVDGNVTLNAKHVTGSNNSSTEEAACMYALNIGTASLEGECPIVNLISGKPNSIFGVARGNLTVTKGKVSIYSYTAGSRACRTLFIKPKTDNYTLLNATTDGKYDVGDAYQLESLYPIDTTKPVVIQIGTPGPSITAEDQTGEVKYGAPSEASYAVTAESFTTAPASYTVKWYDDAKGKTECAAPTGVTVKTNSAASVVLGSDGKTPVGDYYFRLSAVNGGKTYQTAVKTLTVVRGTYTGATTKTIDIANTKVITEKLLVSDVIAEATGDMFFQNLTAPAALTAMETVAIGEMDWTKIDYTSLNNPAKSRNTDEFTVDIVSDNYETISMTLTFASNDLPLYTISATPDTAAFTDTKSGYTTAPAAQTITITNTGNRELTLTQPTAEKYEIGTLTATTLAEDATATFTIRPKTGLTYGEQNETITIEAAATADATKTASATVAATFKVIDGSLPTADITVGNKTASAFSKDVTYKYFYNEAKTVTVAAADPESGVDKIEYLLSGTKFDTEAAVAGTWTDITEGKTFDLTLQSKQFIYVRVTDKEENSKIFNTEGIVVYQNPVNVTDPVKFVINTTDNATATVTLNGNTIKEIKNGTTALATTDYTVSGGTITLQNAYLATLAYGDYTMTVSYLPMGEAYVTDAENTALQDTTFTLKVQKKENNITDISDIGKKYDQSAVAAPTFTQDNATPGITKFEYKLASAADSAYTETAPKAAGTYTVRITVPADDAYEKGVGTKDFTIAKVDVTIEGTTIAATKKYDGTTEASITDAGTLKGTLGGDAVTLTEGKATYADANKGIDKAVTFSEFKLDGTDKGNYNLTAQPTATKAAITAADVAVTLGTYAVSKEWDGTATAGTASGKLTVTGIVAADTGVTVKDTIPVYTDSKVGDYPLTVALSLNGDTHNNYNLTTASIAITAKITKKAVTPAIDDIAAVTYKGTQYKPAITVKESGVTFDAANYDVTYGANKNAGTGTVTIKAKAEGNYSFADVTRNFTINQKDITISGTKVGASKVYDGKLTAVIANAGTPSENYDGANLTVKAGTAVYADKNAGTGIAVTFSGFTLAGSARNNYNLTEQPADTTAAITQKALTVNVAVNNKVHDGNKTATYKTEPKLAGVVAGDTVTLVSGTPEFATAAVGKNIAVNFTKPFAITGEDMANYTLTQPTGIKAAITASEIKVSRIKLSKTSTTMLLGKSETLKAVAAPANATNQAVTWKSSNPSVVKVSSKGKITAVGAGGATITCMAKDGSGKKAACKVTVRKTSTIVALARATAARTSVNLKWNRINNATGYEVYGAVCGKDLKLLATIKNNTTTSKQISHLKKGTGYTFIVRAYLNLNGKKVYIKATNKIHIATTGGKFTNVKAVKLNFTKATIRAGQTKQIKASLKKLNGSKAVMNHAAKFQYVSGNENVATVSASGKITAVKAGTCTIYVYANNGVNTGITVTVR